MALARHRTIPLSRKPPDSLLCLVHPDEKLKYWCSHHQSADCRDCLLFEGKDHKYAQSIFYYLIGEKIRANKIVVQSTFGGGTAPEKLHRKRKQRAVKEVCAAFHAMIDGHFNDLELEMNAIDHINCTATDAYHAQLEKVKKKLEDRGTELTKTLAKRNLLRILQDQKRLANNLDEVAHILATVTIPIRSAVRSCKIFMRFFHLGGSDMQMF